jgi:hypothetical protein
MAGLRLDAAERKHEAARRIAPIGAERKNPGEIESGDDPPARSEPNGVAKSHADQAIVGENEALARRRADMVDEFERHRAGSSLRAVDDFPC